MNTINLPSIRRLLVLAHLITLPWMHLSGRCAGGFQSEAGSGSQTYTESVPAGSYSFRVYLPFDGFGTPGWTPPGIPGDDSGIKRIDVEWSDGQTTATGNSVQWQVDQPLTLRASVTKYRITTTSIPVTGPLGPTWVDIPTEVFAGSETHTWILDLTPSILKAAWVPPLQVPSGTLVTLRANVSGFAVGQSGFHFRIYENDGMAGSSLVAFFQAGTVAETEGNQLVEVQWQSMWINDNGTDPEYFFTVSHAGAPGGSISSGTATDEQLRVVRAQRTIDLSGNMEFGMVAAGTRATNKLYLLNLGNAPIQVSQIQCPTDFQANPGVVEIPALTIRPVDIVFSAVNGGTHAGIITVLSSAEHGDNAIEVRAEVPAVRTLRLETDDLNFGKVGGEKTLPLRVFNDGNVPLQVGPLTLMPPWHIQPGTALIGAHASAVFDVTFEPLAVGSHATNYTIVSDAHSGASDVRLHGLGMSNHVLCTVSPSRLDFGSVALNRTAKFKTTILNSGTTDLTLKSLRVPLGFRAEPQTAIGRDGIVIGPGKHFSVVIAFTPTTLGPYSGVVAYSTDATRNPGVTVQVSGIGAAQEAAVAPVLAAATVSGRHYLSLSGSAGTPYLLEKATGLPASAGAWAIVATITPTNEVPTVVEIPAIIPPGEFYRARIKPLGGR